MRPGQSTDNLIAVCLIANYLFGTIEIPNKGQQGDTTDITTTPNLAVLFGLPISAEILCRNAYLLLAAHQIDGSTFSKATALRAGIAAFKRDELSTWHREILNAGPLPPLLPVGIRRAWIRDLCEKTGRHKLPKEPTQDDLVRDVLWYAFPAIDRAPTSMRAVYDIIDQDFSGAAGKLKRALYNAVTALEVRQ